MLETIGQAVPHRVGEKRLDAAHRLVLAIQLGGCGGLDAVAEATELARQKAAAICEELLVVPKAA